MMIRLHSFDVIQNEHLYGPGKRLLIFVQGCSIHCPGCVNQHIWTFEGGEEYSPESILSLCIENSVAGITILGGEPLDQASGLLEVVDLLKKSNFNVILFTGYWKKDLNKIQKKVWNSADLVIAGNFDIKKRNAYLQFRGSTNQRVIRHKGPFENYKLHDYEETVAIIKIGDNGKMNIKGLYTDEIKAITDLKKQID